MVYTKRAAGAPQSADVKSNHLTGKYRYIYINAKFQVHTRDFIIVSTMISNNSFDARVPASTNVQFYLNRTKIRIN